MERFLTTEDKPWGEVIGASILVMLTTCSGVFVFAAMHFVRKVDSTGENVQPLWQRKFINLVVPSFACGAIFATALFLIIPEALHLLAGGHEDHEEEGEHAEEEIGRAHV